MFFSEISKQINNYSDTHDFRRRLVGQVTISIMEVSKYKSVMLIYIVCMLCVYLQYVSRAGIVYTYKVQTYDLKRTHSRSVGGFNLRFGLVFLENPGIVH